MDMILNLSLPQFFLLTGALALAVGQMVAVMVEWSNR